MRFDQSLQVLYSVSGQGVVGCQAKRPLWHHYFNQTVPKLTEPPNVQCSLGCRCKGDVLQAMEMMVNGYQEELAASSAFSPLGPPPNFHRYSPSRRFLSAPYAGTGYLPTVIRPPPDYALSMVGSLHEMYNSEKTTTSSPGSNTGSDKTSYSE